MKHLFLLLLLILMMDIPARAFELKSRFAVHVVCDTSQVDPVVKTALGILQDDVRKVLSSSLEIMSFDEFRNNQNAVADPHIIEVRQDASSFGNAKEAFRLQASHDGLRVTGSDAHGVAYGLLEISRLLGVSPWEWWADATPKPKDRLVLQEGYVNEQAPSVEFRGIFINDEDWGLMPWASKTYEPSVEKGRIGPMANARIFELLLRLRANTYWPAMHECTKPFFLTEGNREVARQYGIYIGGSHCEPMASSTAGEWPVRGKGKYDFVNNRSNVLQFWEDRVKEVAGQPILYTIGMRGVHDGAMQGAKTVEEQKTVLDSVLKAQRTILGKYVNKDVEQVPQLFIPYKEVLDVYRAGLKVPSDVCLVWCDDNYGMVRHFPTPEERARKGGNGIYYHVSYWGRPHDYLWLGTFSPALMFQQMSQAWHKGIQRFWILNVGDIKPAEYQIELFLDMAWDMNKIYPSDNPDRELQPNNEWLENHEMNFWTREFGKDMARQMLPVLRESYRLAYIRKPEFLGNTRCEEWDKKYSIISDLPWSKDYILTRLADYKKLSDKAEVIGKMLSKAIVKGELPKERKDEFYQLFKYPVQAAAQMNNKLLYGQLARHGKETSEDGGAAYWSKSNEAYDSIVGLTRIYNQGYYNHGKWNRIMDFQPRKQPVFGRVPQVSLAQPMVKAPVFIARWNAADCTTGHPVVWYDLGYEGKAAGIAKNQQLGFAFSGKRVKTDSVRVEVCLVPTHPVDNSKLRIAISLDGGKPQIREYQTEGRSEEWKINTLRCQARVLVTLPVSKLRKHELTVKALDEGVVLDKIYIY